MVSALLVGLVLAVLHVSFAIHVRHVLQASAWEGARVASYADASLAEGVQMARLLIEEGVGFRYSQSVSARGRVVAGRPGVEVVVQAPWPRIAWWSGPGEFTVTAAVPRELPG